MTPMTKAHQASTALALSLIVASILVAPGTAHKPITSPFTYNEDVFPILRDRCGSCHVAGGVAPMSLMTYDETVPWGESIRVELLSGHMPPWSVDAAPTRFQNVSPLSAREMNVLLTWATGGTPLGNPEKAPQPVTSDRQWLLGKPDLELQLPTEFTLAATAQEETVDSLVSTTFSGPRWLRAVDLLPATAAIVRSATVTLSSASPTMATGSRREDVLALWLPGDRPVPVNQGAGFEVPAGAELRVRVRYKKTWQYERQELRDRSTLGLYFAPDAKTPIRAITLAPGGTQPRAGGRLSFSQKIDEDVRAVAIYPNESPANVGIVVRAVAPDGSRRELIAFRPQVGWARRFWFKEPIALKRGTVLETTVTLDDESMALPVSPGASAAGLDLSTVRLTLNVIAGE
ncbi:MAG TPA: hypothetical protein VF065_07920 [Ilumatobacter sp.]